MIVPNFANIPEDLKALPVWVTWRLVSKPGQKKPAKVPYDPRTGARADSSSPETGGTFDEAKDTFERGGYTGVGIILHRGLVGIDLDKCRNPETEVIEPWAQEVVDSLSTYTEVSPSGTGLRIFVWGKKPGSRCKNGPFEMYDSKRFLTVTGHGLPCDPLEEVLPVATGRAKELAALYELHLGGGDEVSAAKADATGPGNDLNADEALALCMRSERFASLWEGDLLDFPSRSEAEQSVLNALAYATAGDPEKMLEAFRECGLWEEKCARTVPKYSIPKAIKGRQGSFYRSASDLFDVVEMEKAPAVALLADGIRASIKSLAEFRVQSPPPRKIHLFPWLKAKDIILVSAPRGVGKSHFCMGVLEALVTGGSFGPWRCLTPAACMYLDAEMAHSDVVERLAGVEPTSAPLYIYSSDLAASLGHPVPNLESPAWRDAMKAVLLDLGVQVLVIDNLSSLTGGDENSKESWSPINRWLLDLRFAGITVILVHHLGKNGSQRGTSAREDNLDASVILSQPKDYQREDGCRFICNFTKARVPQRDLHLLREIEFRASTDDSGRTAWSTNDPTRDIEIAILQGLGEGTPQKKIAEEVGVSPATVSRAKKRAVEKGLLGKDGLTPAGEEALTWGIR